MFFVRNIKVMKGYLTSYIKVSPFVLFRDGASNSWPHALLRPILDRCGLLAKVTVEKIMLI